ncbi:AlpA family phage regulatory protein [Aurantimonas sp. 22II-16-19i]|uniref:helix-turn-helix transcriptional regulator n=1 Tax=Aurantimonas sp. 22II-16-19i TaxID=1317114 RepID=UPI0009F7B013|nr:AlpA family phage regulatory protein [Aurantimonas sp. 22II-16-19i]ORE90614.1 phage transcriptional regulator, AlpA [Aurantimonas sp. 22II-16-19i]
MGDPTRPVPDDCLLPIRTVQRMTGIGPSAIYEWMAKGRFPKAIPLGPRCVRWSLNEINAWIEERKAARDGATG